MTEIRWTASGRDEAVKSFAAQDINQSYLQDLENHLHRLTLRPLITTEIAGGDSNQTRDAQMQGQSQRIYEQTVDRLQRARLMALSGQPALAEREAMQSIETADTLPLDWLRRKRDSLIHDGEDAEFYRFSRMAEAPSNVRLDCAEIFIENNHPAAARTLINQSLNINPEVADQTQFENINRRLNNRLPQVRDPEPDTSSLLKIDGLFYEENPAQCKDFLPLFRKNIELMDTNSDNFVSDREIDVALTNPYLKGADAAFVALLKKKAPQFRNLSDDEFGIENDGITLKDMKVFDRMLSEMAANRVTPSHLEAMQSAAGIIGAQERHFKQLSGEQVLSLTAAPWLKREQRKAVAETIVEFNNLNLTKDGIEDKVNDLRLTYELPLSVQEMLNSINERLYGKTRSLYANEEQPEESITQMTQQDTDNTFLQGIKATATSNPHLIAKMIVSNQDGSYTINFPGAPKEPVTIVAPTDSELATYTAPAQFGMWLPIIEKAYEKYCTGRGSRPSIEKLMTAK